MFHPCRRIAQWSFVGALIFGGTIGLASGMIVAELGEGGIARVLEAWSGIDQGIGEAGSKGGMIGSFIGLALTYRSWRNWALNSGTLSQEELNRIIPF